MPRRLYTREILRLCLACLLIGGLSSCGGGGGGATATPPTNVFVSIAPANPAVLQGGTQQFAATITGTTNTGVIWTVLEGAAGGSITPAGLYTSPKAKGVFHVVATSVANTTKSASASVSVPDVFVQVDPTVVDMGPGENLTFAANVYGTVSTAVSWTIQEGASGGVITTAGAYTAPGTFGTFHVVATSQWDTTKVFVVPVSVGPVTVSIFPTADELGPAGLRPFTATVTGTLTKTVTWAIQEGSAGGSISTSGAYTAPAVLGTFHVVTTSVKDPTKTATATVTIVASGFQPTGSMRDNRTGHTATLLKTGKVLVAGGDACFFYAYYGSCLLSSSELYDPATGTFAAAGTMLKARSFHTATLLSDGRVLVAGGGSSAAAELYDPAAGFSSTGSMNVGRNSHTATLLGNGRVLVAGGAGGLSAAEEYDPTKGSFAAVGNMVTGRSQHTATLLGNGKVLIVGGTNAAGPLASAELYDPSTGSVTATGSMTQQRTGHTATLLPDGSTLVAGGSDGKSPLASAEIYSVTSGKFTAVPATMIVTRDSHVAVLLANGTVLLAGGDTTNPADFLAELYNPVTGLFTQTGSMEVGRVLATAVVLPDGRVLVAGGSDLNSAEIYK